VLSTPTDLRFEQVMLALPKIIAPLLVGLLFVSAYFLPERGEFFKFLAYSPRKREGSRKIGSIVFGAALTLVAIYNLFAELLG